jgi:hypothetical protein
MTSNPILFPVPHNYNVLDTINEYINQYYIVTNFYHTLHEGRYQIGFMIGTELEKYHQFYIDISDHEMEGGSSNILPKDVNFNTSVYKHGLYLFTDLPSVCGFIQSQFQQFLKQEEAERNLLNGTNDNDNPVLKVSEDLDIYFRFLYNQYRTPDFLTNDNNKQKIAKYYELLEDLPTKQIQKRLKI